MADDIVILSDSDEDSAKNLFGHKSAPTVKNSVQIQKKQQGKRKSTLDDEKHPETPAAKRPTFYAEGSPKNVEQRANCGTPKLPQIVTVDTLATPSATPPLQLLASPPRNTKSPRDTQPLNNQQTTLDVDASKGSKEPVRRVKLTTVLKESDDAWQEVRQKRLQTGSSVNSSELQNTQDSKRYDGISPTAVAMDLTNSHPTKANEIIIENKTDSNSATRPVSEEKHHIEKEYEELIAVCRKADPSADMQKLIDTKLLKYYNGVHPDFVKSRGFRKTVINCIERIRAEPDLVYYNLKAVVDELNVRRKSKDVVITNEEASPNVSSSNGVAGGATPAFNKHTEEQIKKLNKALYILKKRIFRLEEADVDLDDDNSAFLQMERFKKRACQIYEKICDLTGESKHARRLVKKPIQFSGTDFPAFNKTLQAYINRTKEFPDFFDVLRMMEHCNRQYDLKLANFEMKRIAQDAFLKVGKILQSRRKTDLYEMVTHFTANMEDPAKSDPDLLAKLNENQKTQTSISKVLETYARAQDDPLALEQLKKENEEAGTTNRKENGKGGGGDFAGATDDSSKLHDHNLASEDDTDDDDDDEEGLDEHVEKLTKDNTIDISDEEIELEMSYETTDKNKETDALISKDKNEVKENIDLKLTENNNIMRTKTNSESSSTEAKAVAAAKDAVITNKDDKIKTTAAIDISQKTQSHEVTENKSSLKDKASTSTLKETTNKTAQSKDGKPLRTIAEIVISDEE